jgi:hypothetical protein
MVSRTTNHATAIQALTQVVARAGAVDAQSSAGCGVVVCGGGAVRWTSTCVGQGECNRSPVVQPLPWPVPKNQEIEDAETGTVKSDDCTRSPLCVILWDMATRM